MPKHTISAERASFIAGHFFQWSFDKPDDFLPDKDQFLQMRHPAELHYLASIYNWDDDPIVLEWIVDSPLCARSTANLIFWRSLPSYFEDSDFSDPSTCPSYCEPGFALIPRVLERYKRKDFSPTDVSFNPKGEMEPVTVRNGKWEVPPGVYDEIEGLDVEVEE